MTDQERPVEERNELLDDLLTAAMHVAVDEQDQSQTVVAPDRGPGARLLDERAHAPKCITAGGKHCGVRPFELSFHVVPGRPRWHPARVTLTSVRAPSA